MMSETDNKFYKIPISEWIVVSKDSLISLVGNTMVFFNILGSFKILDSIESLVASHIYGNF